jgi:Ferritin-like domain
VEIGQHEQTHVALLTAALGAQAPQACNYSLCVFLAWVSRRGELMPVIFILNSPITDVRSFVLLSQVFEDVGALHIFVWWYNLILIFFSSGSSAYAGAISLLTLVANILTSASILGTEVRQATWVSTSVNKGVPWGSSFQVSLHLHLSKLN